MRFPRNIDLKSTIGLAFRIGIRSEPPFSKLIHQNSYLILGGLENRIPVVKLL